MLYSEYLESTSVRWWREKYPTLAAYLKFKFKNYEIAYTLENMDNLIQSFVMDNIIEIAKAEEIVKTDIFKSKEKWGMLSKSTTNTNTSGSTEDKILYSGLNNEGDFSGSNSNVASSGVNDTTSNNVDELSIVMTLANSNMYQVYRELSKQFIKLLIIIF